MGDIIASCTLVSVLTTFLAKSLLEPGEQVAFSESFSESLMLPAETYDQFEEKSDWSSALENSSQLSLCIPIAAVFVGVVVDLADSVASLVSLVGESTDRFVFRG